MDLTDEKKSKEWCIKLQEKMNDNSSMSEQNILEFKNNSVLYSLKTYGVEVTNICLDEAFFNSAEYKKIEAYSDQVESMFDDETYIQKGAKEMRQPRPGSTTRTPQTRATGVGESQGLSGVP